MKLVWGLVFLLFLLVATCATAQPTFVQGGFGLEVKRFPGEPGNNVFDGTANMVTVGGGGFIARHSDDRRGARSWGSLDRHADDQRHDFRGSPRHADQLHLPPTWRVRADRIPDIASSRRADGLLRGPVGAIVGIDVAIHPGKHRSVLAGIAHDPPQTLYPPTIPWDARQQKWWTSIVRQASDAGLGWLAAACWGEGSTADPVILVPLLRAIDANGGRTKIALFDDTTSEVLRKNLHTHGEWALSPRCDLADMSSEGEGAFAYYYDQQWQRFFATVPDRYRLKINGRPVVFMWHGGAEWYTNQRSFHTVIDALRDATRRDFGVDPFVIVEESWSRLDSALRPDGMYDWFDARENHDADGVWRRSRRQHCPWLRLQPL